MSELDRLLSRFNLSQESLEKQCSDGLFLSLSEKIISFDCTAPYFDLTEVEIEEIRLDCQGERLRKMKMLWQWKRKKGSDATNLAIVRIFLRIEDKSLAELVLKESLSATAHPNPKRLTDCEDQENTSSALKTVVEEPANLKELQSDACVPEHTLQNIESKGNGGILNIVGVTELTNPNINPTVTSISEQTVHMHTLGRRFQLGMLYDFPNDNLLPHNPLWNYSSLKRYVVQTPLADYHCKAYVTNETTPAEVLGVEGNLKLNFLGGLIKESDVSGSARYLYDYTSKQHAQVAIYYKYTSHREQVEYEMLPNEVYCTLSCEDVGTHVVTEILYGAEAIFVIDQEVADYKKYKHINAELFMNALQACSAIEGHHDVELMLIPTKDRLTFTYFGDFHPQEKISTFQDVANFCKNLPKLLTREGSSNLVANKVRLHPLSMLNNVGFSHLDLSAKIISTHLVIQIEKIIQHLHDVEIRCNSLIKTNVYQYFIGIQEQLSMFSTIVSKYKHDFLEELAILLPKIRTEQEQEQEQELGILCEKYLTSHINCEVLSTWIEEKECEVTFVAKCLEELRQIPGVKFEFPIHNSVFATKKRVIAFEFTAINKIDQGLMKMSAYMNSGKQDFEQPVKIPWYKSIATKGKVTLKMRQFSSYAKSKAIYNDESVIFIVTDTSEDTCICDNAVRIVSYTNGKPDNQDFKTPSPYQIMTPPLVAGPPGKPSVVNTTSNSIGLKWEKPQENPEYTHSYKVLYCSRDDLPNSQWKYQLTDSVVEHITISELIPNKCYYFKVQALYHKTASKESPISDAISTKHVVFGPPGECRAEDVTHDSVTLYWSKPPNINPSKIERYKVLYRFDPDPHGDWKSKITDDEKTTIKIHGLSPETKYIFKVQARSSDHHFGKESKESDNIMTKSAICSPPGKPRVEVRDSSVVQLKWSKPLKYADTIQHYAVLYRSMDDETQQWQKYEQNSTIEEILVKGLFPDTRYRFKILAECKSGASEESETSNTVQTLVPIPSKPGQPIAVSVTSKSINLIWAKPAQYPEFVTKYCVSYRSQQSKEWLLLHVDGEKETVTVTGLSPKTTYLFKVQAQSKTGSSEMSEVSTAICILPPDPTQPGQPQALNTSHDEITITWAKPRENAEYIHNYIIHYKSLQKSDKHGWTTVKTESAVEELIVSGLEVDTCYIFKLQAESVDGPSKESETSNVIQTLVPIPSKPGQPKSVSVTHNSVCLKWTKPTHYSEYVMNYHVNYCPQEQSKEWLSLRVRGEEQTVTVTGLSPKTTYLFKVQSQSKTGFSEMSDVSTGICTLPPVPSQPGQPQAVHISHDKITITWAKPQENAEYIHSYTIHYKLLQKSDRYGWTTVKTENAVEVLVVSGLEINTSYIFKVQAQSVDGPSKESQISNAVRTLVPVPSKPGQPIAVSVTSKSINLIWAKPAQYPEFVTNYCVSYCSQESKEWLSLHVDGEKETATVTGLSPKTTYFFKVQAQSKTGSSEMSEVSTAICLLPPDPTQPGQPQAVNISHDEITVTWAKPQENAEYIQNYTIHYKSLLKSDHHVWTKVKTESAMEELAVSGLEVNTSYIFKVQAESVDGPSKESETSNVIQTLVPIPSKPGQPKSVSVTHNSINLKWTKPTQYSEYVMNYHVSYCPQKQSKEWLSLRVQGEKETVTVTGLSPKTTYLFKVQAQSKTGFSEMSEVSTGIRTLPPVPSQPGQPKAVNISHDKITITWAKPQENAEYIHSYIIHYKLLQKSDRHGWTTVKTESAMEVLVVSGLEINTSYIFKVQAESVDGSSKESETSDMIQTLVPIPSKPGQPKTVSATHNSVNLKWTKPTQYSEYVINYHVTYCSQEQSKEWLSLRVQGEKETVIVTGLSPKTTYLFKVQSQSKTGFSEMSEVSTGICTLPPVPSQPGQPQAVHISHDKITVTWAKPQENAEYIIYYIIYYKSLQISDKHGWTTVKTESAVEKLIVSGLEVDTCYIFKVQAESVDGPSKESETSNVIQTLVPIPSKPGQPKAVSITHNSVSLKWTKPTHYAEYIMNYHVSYCSQEQSKEWLSLRVQGEKETVTVTGLSPKTTYLFKVQAQSKTGFSETSEVSTGIRTLPPVPSQPGQPKAVNVSHDKITITWAKPQENAEFIQSYIIHYKSLQKSDRHGWTSVKTESAMEVLVVSGLEINTRYIFKVQAESVDGSSKESETSDMIQTLVPIPSKPGQPKTVSATHNSVNLKWTKPTQYSEYVMNYHVSYCSQEQSKEWLSLRVQGEKETVTVTGLSPKTTYLFKVQAQSKTGFSEMSEVSTGIRTLPPVPSQPGQPKAVNVSHDKIAITWAKPQENAEYIQSYTIHYKSLQKSNIHGWTTVKTKSAMEVLVVSGLEINTSYIFKVQAESVNGSSEVSETSNVIQTLVPIPSKPGQPKVVSVTHNSVSLEWTKPTQYSEYVMNYHVSYCPQKQSKELISLHVQGEEETVTVTGLSPKMTYLFKVQAQSKTGFSEMSEVSTAICTLPPVPSQPGQPKAVHVSHDKITITWAKPQENAEYIHSYTIHYKSLQKSDRYGWTTVKTESAMEVLVVSGLEINTSYIFKVQAESVDGSSKEGDTSDMIQTLVPIPSKPGQPKVVSVTHNSVSLEWTKPTQYSEYVAIYQCRYFSQEEPEIQILFITAEEKLTVTGLSPETIYHFKVQAQSKTGLSETNELVFVL